MTDIEILKELARGFGLFEKTTIEDIEKNSYSPSKRLLYAIDKQNNIIGLTMDYSNLTGVPAVIQNLIHLQYLSLNYNRIVNISSLQYLKKIKTLKLNGNAIAYIYPLQELNHLVKLYLLDNPISDFSCLKSNTSLKILRITGFFTNGLSNISKLEQLEELNLTKIKSKDFDFSFLSHLKNLKTLHLNNNAINDISFLEKLVSLEELSLAKNKISNLTVLKNLTLLKSIDLSHNEIADISTLENLQFLEKINLSNNVISNISSLKQLVNLHFLDLRTNLVREIPAWINELDIRPEWNGSLNFGNLLLSDNPIDPAPPEIVKQGTLAIKNWFAASKKRLNEIKILLVGDANAGKTSICRILKYGTFDANEPQTDGIIIEQLKFSQLETFKDQKELYGTIAYLWDFGGQEIMSSTHQFFMTKRSVYILVLEARKDVATDKQVRNWMERIHAFGDNSPVIIVGNKIDLNPAFGIDSTALQRDFPQIKHYINVSCTTGENIENLKFVLERNILQSELFTTEIDERWLNIKTELQEITKVEYKLSHDEFSKVCSRHSVGEEQSQTQAIKFLNDLGIVLHFDDLRIAEYYVLDPLWVTTGVYKIITSNLVAKNKGEISISDLPSIVNMNTHSKKGPKKPIIYSPNECKYLADIMVEFKLCYYVNLDTLLVPDLLDKETPKAESDYFYNISEKLFVKYVYKYLPATVMPRIIVELREDVEKQWRTGVLLTKKNLPSTKAMIVAIEDTIQIIVLGEYKQKREYLSVIRYIIDEINSSYNVEINIMIPLPKFEKYEVKYEILKKMERAGEKIYKNWDIEKEFEIGILLDGIINQENMIKQAITTSKKAKIKIFLASSLELKEDREQFEIFIGRKNKILIDEGIFIDLIIWEDFIDSMSATRLQDEYNKAIMDSDLFVMLFYTKVGMYTAEEFETAFGEFGNNKKPLIYTYFKNAEINTGNINRQDVNSLLDFKEKLSRLGHFATEYKNIDDLKYKFDQQLIKYIRKNCQL